jgi:hypothetical protein
MENEGMLILFRGMGMKMKKGYGDANLVDGNGGHWRG